MPDPQPVTFESFDLEDRNGNVQTEQIAASNHAIVRQAIVDARRAVVGYELSEVPVASNNSDATLFDAVSNSACSGPAGRRLVLVRCTFEHIESGSLDLLNPEKVVLEVPIDVAGSDAHELLRQRALLLRARKSGFKLAFDHSVLRPELISWLPLAYMIQLDMRVLAPGKAEQIVRDVQGRSKANVVARNIENNAQYEQLKRAGAKLFQGHWFAEPAPIDQTQAHSNRSAVLHLLSLVRREAEIGEIEEVLKRDPTMSFNLLRFINSCGFGLNTEITSFRHAVMILGLNKLFRWATLLMTAMPADSVAPAAGSLAVVRGRLMELLVAELNGDESGDDAFIVGVFSMLETLIGVPLAQALQSLNLPTAVNEALLDDTGVFAPFLRMVKCCESNDELPFNQAAAALQLSSHQVNYAHLQALAWADQLGV